MNAPMHKQAIKAATTSIRILASKEDVWKKVGFYEHVNKRPTWLLRLSLPVPREVEGAHSKVGDICRCKYSDGGYLTKRITHVVPKSRIEFEIVEQSIRYQGAVKLLGGHIEIQSMGDVGTIVHMVTYYENRIGFAALSSLCIDMVIKSMHRFVIEDMRLQLEDNLVNASTTLAE